MLSVRRRLFYDDQIKFVNFNLSDTERLIRLISRVPYLMGYHFHYVRLSNFPPH